MHRFFFSGRLFLAAGISGSLQEKIWPFQSGNVEKYLQIFADISRYFPVFISYSAL
jgi:hypothetical protein